MRVDHVLKDDEEWYPAVRTVAANTEVCVVFVSVFQVEGRDRQHLKLDHNGEQLIKEVEGSCSGQVVVVLHIGGQVLVEEWVRLLSTGRSILMMPRWTSPRLARCCSLATQARRAEMPSPICCSARSTPPAR